jgi:hypothetical protein
MESDNASLQRQIDELRAEISATKTMIGAPERKGHHGRSIAVLAGALLVGSMLGNALATGINVSQPRPQQQGNIPSPPKSSQPGQQNSNNQGNSTRGPFVAPFVVLSKAGDPLFTVLDSGEVVMFGKNGMIHFNQDSKLAVKFEQNGGQEAELGEGQAGPLGLRFRNHDKFIAALGFSNKGLGSLTLNDSNGENVVLVAATPQGGYIGTFDSNKELIALQKSSDGGGEVDVYHAGTDVPAALISAKAGGGLLKANKDADDGATSVAIAASDQGIGVKIKKDNQERALLEIGKDNESTLTLEQKTDTQQVAMTTSAQGGIVNVFDLADTKPVVYLNSDGNGGIVKVAHGSSQGDFVAIAATPTVLGLQVRKGDKRKVSLGLDDNGTPNVSVYGAGNNPSAEIQTYDNGKGEIAVFNEGKAVASLSESSSGGGGNVTVDDPKGNGIFSAGYSPADQADVCLDRKNHLWCMGINLPLQMTK